MDYNGGTALYKYQWDYIHDPQTMLFAWAEEEEEGAAKCYGIFDDCEEVTEILLKIRNARINNKKQKIKRQSIDEIIRFVGKNIDIENTEFNEIQIIFNPNKSQEVIFDPNNYYEIYNEQNLYADKNGNGYIEIHSGFVFRDTNNIECFRIIINKEGVNYNVKKDILSKYLFGDEKVVKDVRKEKIDKAIEEMKQYLGFPYEYGGGASRTSMDSKGVEEMDCSEFVSRFLQKACGLEKVPEYTTQLMSDWLDNNNQGDDILEYVPGSDNLNFKDIQSGDVFLWRTAKGGHTGVVVSYNSTTDLVTVIEAIGESGACEESLSKNVSGYCKGCIRISIYTRTGKSLAKHDGWKGYFRPKIK